MDIEILPQNVAMIIFDQDGWFFRMNSAAEQLLGGNVIDFINNWQSTRGNVVFEFNHRNIRIDTLKTDQATYVMLFDEGNNSPGEQTVDPHSREFKQPSQDLMSVKAKSMAMIAHQFGTPISAVRLKSYLLKKHLDSLSKERITEHLDQIEAQLDQMVDLLDDLLLVNQVYSSEQTATFSPLDLEAFCKKIINPMTLDLDEREIVLTYSGRINNVQLDRRLIRYLLSNLVRCVLKYSVSTVHLDIRRVENIVTFSVSAPNVAILASDLDELFNQAQRGNNGMGLGLSIMKMCVEVYDGTLTVENRSGSGTTFVVSLPCRDAR
jgi:signal transduction histidine kinase